MRKTPTRSAAWIALAYAVLAGIWALVTHLGLNTLMLDPRNYVRFDLPTDVMLAILTVLLLFILLRRELTHREEANEALRRSHEELELRVRQRTAALDAERGLLRAVIENAPAAIALFNGAGLRVRWSNRLYCQTLPRPLRDIDIDGLSLAEVLPAAPDNGVLEIFKRVADTGHSYVDPEAAYWESDSGTTYWDWSLVPLAVNGQEVPDILSVAHDVTDQVLARKHLEKMKLEAECRAEELRQAHIDLETRARELAALLNISHDLTDLTATPATQPLLELILDHLKTMIDYTGATMITPEDDGMVVVAHRGPAPLEEIIGAWAPPEQAPGFQEVLRRREPVIVGDLESDEPLALQIKKTAGYQARGSLGTSRSWLGVPLMIEDRVVGLLRLDHTAPHFFTPRHAQLAMAIANHAAIALENARLYEEAGKVASLEERQRLALELHDSVSQALYGIALGAHAAREQVSRAPDKLPGTLDYILTLSERAVAQVRALVFELRPDSIEQETLVGALPRLAATLRVVDGVAVHLELCEEPVLSLAAKEAFYRVSPGSTTQRRQTCPRQNH